MSYHYDVEAAVASFRASHSNAIIPADAPNFAHIQFRNSEISVAFLRMLLTELNKGSDHQDILLGAASIMTDFIQNFAVPYAPEERPAVYHAFVHHIAGLLNDELNGEQRFVNGGEAVITGEEGGRA